MPSIFRKIWAVYAVLLFLILMALSFPVFLLPMIFTPGERALKRNIHYLYHQFTPFFFALVGVRMRVHGLEKLDSKQSYVIVGNHQSSIDFIINAHAFPGIFRFLAKQELVKIPIFGWVVNKMCLIVDRSSAMSRARSVVNIKNHLADGWSVFIYPEGGRNRTEEQVAPFIDGAFRIAIQTGAPIAIQTILNVNDVSNSVGAVDLQPGVVEIMWDAPIETSGLKVEDIPALKEQVRSIMIQRLNEYKQNKQNKQKR